MVSGKKSVSSRPPKTALNSDFFPFYLTEKTSDLHIVLEAFIRNDCVKELCKKSIEKIMWNSTYTQKSIISAFIKALQMKLLPSAGTQFTLRSVSQIKYGTPRKRYCSSRLMFNNLTKLTKILSKKKSVQQVLFHFSRNTGNTKIFSLFKKPQVI